MGLKSVQMHCIFWLLDWDTKIASQMIMIALLNEHTDSVYSCCLEKSKEPLENLSQSVAFGQSSAAADECILTRVCVCKNLIAQLECSSSDINCVKGEIC